MRVTTTTLSLILLIIVCLGICLGHGQCINYNFKCCDIVDYPVYGLTAKSTDNAICITLNVIFNENPQWSKDCQDAFTDTYCLTAVAQCCSKTNPVVFTPCASSCDEMMDSCSNSTSTNSTSACGAPVWYEPPCNSGNGGPCPSDEVSTPFAFNNFLNRTALTETIPNDIEFISHFQNIADELLQTMHSGETSKDFKSLFSPSQRQ